MAIFQNQEGIIVVSDRLVEIDVLTGIPKWGEIKMIAKKRMEITCFNCKKEYSRLVSIEKGENTICHFCGKDNYANHSPDQ